MNIRRTTIVKGVMAAVICVAAVDPGLAQAPAERQSQVAPADGPMAQMVRAATAAFRNTQAAERAGYELASGCVSGPEEGAMGVHFVNPTLVGDGTLDAARPEALVYEPVRGQLQLVAVEYIVLAEQWDAANPHPPVLNGQHFHFVPAPNRTGLDAYYELHVWAWKRNPNGTFTDWNPRVSCESYSAP